MKTIKLKWKKEDNASGYRVNVYLPSGEVFHANTVTNEYEYQAEELGTYKWSVTAFNNMGDAGESERWEFTVTNKKPDPVILISPNNGTVVVIDDRLSTSIIQAPTDSDNLTFNIVVSNFVGVGAISLSMVYDPAVLEYVGHNTQTQLFPNWQPPTNTPDLPNSDKKLFKLGWFSQDPSQVMNAPDGYTLFTITFKHLNNEPIELTWDERLGQNEYASHGGATILSVFYDLQ